MADDAVEDGDATAYGKQQQRQQGADGPHAPGSGAAVESGLGPDLLAGMARLDIAEGEGDVGGGLLGRVVRVVVRAAAGRPGFGSDEGEAGQEQHQGERVQGLVEGKRVVERSGGAQVG